MRELDTLIRLLTESACLTAAASPDNLCINLARQFIINHLQPALKRRHQTDNINEFITTVCPFSRVSLLTW